MTKTKKKSAATHSNKNYVQHLKIERCKLSITHLYALLYACSEHTKDVFLDECVQVLQSIENDFNDILRMTSCM